MGTQAQIIAKVKLLAGPGSIPFQNFIESPVFNEYCGRARIETRYRLFDQWILAEVVITGDVFMLNVEDIKVKLTKYLISEEAPYQDWHITAKEELIQINTPLKDYTYYAQDVNTPHEGN